MCPVSLSTGAESGGTSSLLARGGVGRETRRGLPTRARCAYVVPGGDEARRITASQTLIASTLIPGSGALGRRYGLGERWHEPAGVEVTSRVVHSAIHPAAPASIHPCRESCPSPCLQGKDSEALIFVDFYFVVSSTLLLQWEVLDAHRSEKGLAVGTRPRHQPE